MIKDRFDRFKCSEEALAQLEEYHQNDKDTEDYLINFQNLRSEASITEDFAKRILLKNTREDLVKEALTSADKMSYKTLVRELQRLGKASQIFSLLASE